MSEFLQSSLPGGVLFALEEGASFLKQMLTWRMVRIAFCSFKYQSQNYLFSSFKIPGEKIYKDLSLFYTVFVIVASYCLPLWFNTSYIQLDHFTSHYVLFWLLATELLAYK